MSEISASFSQRMRQLRPSTIREILKVAAQPEIISFAGGLPAPELFPIEAVQAASDYVLSTIGRAALQYGASEGFMPLREWIAAEVARCGIEAAPADVLVTNGSQQMLDLVGKLLLNPGDVVLTENPTYLAAIQAFQTFEAKFTPIPTDKHGLIPEALPKLIIKHRPKFLYTIPNFQNPTSITLVAERRAQLAKIAAKHYLIVVEDDPYGKLRYQGADVPPVKHWDEANCVIYVSTFSKTIAPGLRLGWAIATQEIFSQLLILKQASDLHTSSFDQRVAWAFLTHNNHNVHLERIRHTYSSRFDVMDAALKAEMPAGFSWSRPEGGMFLWVTGPTGFDGVELLQRAIAHKVAFVPGRDFFPMGAGNNFLRLNYSNSTPERIREGVHRIAELCHDETLVTPAHSGAPEAAPFVQR